MLGRVATHDSIRHGLSDYVLHPSVLDACLHVIFAARMSDEDEERGFYLPVHIDRYRCHRRPAGDKLWTYVRVTEASGQYLSGDFWIMDEDGTLLAEVQGLQCKYIEGSRKGDADLAYGGCYEYAWEEAPDLNLKPAPNTTVLMVADDRFDGSALLASLGGAGRFRPSDGNGRGCGVSGRSGRQGQRACRIAPPSGGGSDGLQDRRWTAAFGPGPWGHRGGYG